MELSIIIVNWNSKEFLRNCLHSIKEGEPHLDYEVVVADNASFDGAAQMLAVEFPNVKFIQIKDNLGFAAANNIAARQASGEVLLFLNPDTHIEPGALTQLLQAFGQLPDAAVLGAKLLNSDRTLQNSCVQSFPTIIGQALSSDLLRRWFPSSKLWGMKALFDGGTAPQPVDAVSGACLMIKQNSFNHLRGFDEHYFMYSEDIDLCFRVYQSGLRCYYVPTAIVVHHGGASSSQAFHAFPNIMTRESVYRFLCLRRGKKSAFGFRLAMGLSAMIRLPLLAVLCLLRIKKGGSFQLSARKWVSIFCWSIGAEKWTANH